MNNLDKVVKRSEAIADFEATHMPYINAREKINGRKDMPRRREMWNDFVDALNKNNLISDWQADNWSQPAHICKRPTAWIGQRGKIGQTPTNDKENSMKTGDLVRMNEEDYPKYEGKVGVLVEERRVDQFVVSVDGKDHPFFIHRTSMEKVN